MSWVSENKFLTGFGVVMLAGVGTLGWLTWSAMGKYDDATGAFEGASGELKKLQESKPSLNDPNLKELVAQKEELTKKIGDFQKELKSRVLPVEPIKKEAFQDKLKETVAKVAAKAAEARVERPKDFYLGFSEYQSKPPDDKAAPALARELRAIELVMDVLIQTGKSDGLELNEFQREPLPEEGKARTEDGASGGKRRNAADRSERGGVERNGLQIKITSSDEALRKILTGLANHKQQLFVIRNLTVQNKQAESPQRVGVAAPLTPAPASAPAPDQPAAAPVVPAAPAANTPPPSATPPAPATAPAAAAPALAPAASEGPLAYVFGTEKIVSTLEIEILNIEEPKAAKPEKGEKKKDKEK